MEKYAELKELIASAQKDAAAFFEKGNKAAGTCLRGALQQAKTLAQDVPNEVTAKKSDGK